MSYDDLPTLGIRVDLSVLTNSVHGAGGLLSKVSMIIEHAHPRLRDPARLCSCGLLSNRTDLDSVPLRVRASRLSLGLVSVSV